MPMAGEDQSPSLNEEPSGEANKPPEHSPADHTTDIASKRCSRSHPNAKPSRESGTLSITNPPKLLVEARCIIDEDKCDVDPKTEKSLDIKVSTLEVKGACEKSTAVASSKYIDRRINQRLRRRKTEIVDCLMDTILTCLVKNISAYEEPLDGNGSSPRSQKSGGMRMTHPQRKCTGRKRQLQGDDQENEEKGDEDGREDRTIKRPKTTSDDEDCRYACPYYKFDQDRFKNCRTCCGPGWKDVHRVKEHLIRCHHLPKFQCNRCCELFKEEDELKRHQRATEPCPVRDKPAQRNLADGFDQEQEKKLLKRYRTDGHDKWIGWYCILFDVEPGSPGIPSPYHGVSKPSEVQDLPSHASQAAYQQWLNDFVLEKISPLIRTHVEREVDKALLGAEDQIRQNVMGALKDIPDMIYKEFRSMSSSSPTDMAAPSTDEKEDRTEAGEAPPPLTFDCADVFSTLDDWAIYLDGDFEFSKDDFDPLPTLSDEFSQSLVSHHHAPHSNQSRRSSETLVDANVADIQSRCATENFEELSKGQGYDVSRTTNFLLDQY